MNVRVFAAAVLVAALAVAAVILVFGLLGFAGGLDFFSTDGDSILGMSSNGLLSTISVLTAAVLVVAALRSPRTAWAHGRYPVHRRTAGTIRSAPARRGRPPRPPR